MFLLFTMCKLSIAAKIKRWTKILFQCSLFFHEDSEPISINSGASTTRSRMDSSVNGAMNKTKVTPVTVANDDDDYIAQAQLTKCHVNGSSPHSNCINECLEPEDEDNMIVCRIKEDGSLCIENLREEGLNCKANMENVGNGPEVASDGYCSNGEASFSYMVSDGAEAFPLPVSGSFSSTRSSFAFPV